MALAVASPMASLSLHSGRLARPCRVVPMGSLSSPFLRSSFVSSSSTSSAASTSPAALAAAVSASLTFTSSSSFAGGWAADKIKERVRPSGSSTMAPAAMAAPVASVSPRSAGRAVAAGAFSRGGGGVCSGTRSCCLPPPGSAKIMLPPRELGGSVMQRRRLVPRSSTSDSQATKQEKAPFGYTRKDVLLIGVGVTVFGVGLKSGLELLGVDPLQAGNVVQLLVVLGMTVGWISTYMFRVANKDMTYAHQLRDYEKQVMEKRLESLSEAELQALLEQVEEEKQRMPAIVPDEPNAITFKKK